MLATVVLALHDDTRRYVGYAYSALGFIYVLTARAARSVGVDFKVFFLDLYLYIVV